MATQVTKLEVQPSIKVFWGLVVLLGLIIVYTSKASDPAILAAGVFLGVVSLLPLYLWMTGWSQGLPAWQIFAFITGWVYTLPMFQASKPLAEYSSFEIVWGAVVTAGFILLGTMVSVAFEGRGVKPPRALLMISQSQSIRYLLGFVFLGLLFGVNEAMGFYTFPGNTRMVFRGIIYSLATMGLFVLSYYDGRGLLDKSTRWMFVAGALGSTIMALCSLMLAEAMVPVSMVIFGYTLGSSKVPWKLVAGLFFVLSILHSGKYEMRTLYWGGEEAPTKKLTLTTLPEFYSEWFRAGLTELGGTSGVFQQNKTAEEEKQATLFERSGNLHMLLLVMRKSPSEVPYMAGATYSFIPSLLIPRFIHGQKGIPHAANQMLSVNYGMVTVETMGNVSIGWGLLPEAYANFGLVGVGALAVALGIFYTWISRMTVGVPMTSLRFVTGLLIISAATRADTMAIFITSQFQGIVGVTIAAFILMRRQPNPFINNEPGFHGPAPYRQPSPGVPDGMPAPGYLTDLIEGAAARKRHSSKAAAEAPSPAGAPASNGETPSGELQRAYKTPMRAAAWMPRSLRMRILTEQREQAALAAQTAAASGNAAGGEVKQRPRQLAVPYRNYRRYRG